ncbi:MAG: hypothetical protein IJM23_05970, partial [Lachnospiraceae bacterium]|nr:hypothetical protein [Lachnospiraceae bacterium]
RHGNFLNQGFFLAIFLHIIEREKLAKVRKFKDCQVFCLVSRTTVSTWYAQQNMSVTTALPSGNSYYFSLFGGVVKP